MLFADAKTMVFIPDETWRTHDQIISLRGPYNSMQIFALLKEILNKRKCSVTCPVMYLPFTQKYSCICRLLMYLPKLEIFTYNIILHQVITPCVL